MRGTTSEETVVVVCAADDAYAMPLAVMLYSLLSHFRGDNGIHIYVVDDGIAAHKRRKIEGIAGRFEADVRWIAPPEGSAEGLPAGTYYSVATYYRLLVPQLLPDLEKAIYLDSDLIVQEDLSKLWDREVGAHYFLATRDEGYPFVEEVPHLVSCPGFVIEEGAEYFNAGVLVMNLARWREEGFSDQVLTFLRRWGHHLLCADQDGLNALAQGRWGKLDNRWNQCIPTWENANDVMPGPGGIVHYMGPHKPWSGQAIYPSRELFERYLRASGWYDDAEWARYRLSMSAIRSWTSVRHFARTMLTYPRRLRARLAGRLRPPAPDL